MHFLLEKLQTNSIVPIFIITHKHYNPTYNILHIYIASFYAPNGHTEVNYSLFLFEYNLRNIILQ